MLIQRYFSITLLKNTRDPSIPVKDNPNQTEAMMLRPQRMPCLYSRRKFLSQPRWSLQSQNSQSIQIPRINTGMCDGYSFRLWLFLHLPQQCKFPQLLWLEFWSKLIGHGLQCPCNQGNQYSCASANSATVETNHGWQDWPSCDWNGLQWAEWPHAKGLVISLQGCQLNPSIMTSDHDLPGLSLPKSLNVGNYSRRKSKRIHTSHPLISQFLYLQNSFLKGGFMSCFRSQKR